MKKLILMRHGQAEEAIQVEISISIDVSRLKDARMVGQRMQTLPKVWLPKYVICSSATRASQTWDAVRTELKMRRAVHYSQELLGCSVGLMVDMLMSIPDTAASVLIIGHNPVWESLCERFTGLSRLIRPADVLLFENEAESWVTASTQGLAACKARRPNDFIKLESKVVPAIIETERLFIKAVAR